MKDLKEHPINDQHFEVVYEHSRGQVPSVSVIVSLYNYQQYIEECLESVKNQTLQAFDLLVVDDCSQDNSTTIVKKWMKQNYARFNRCCLLRHKQNLGLAPTRNTAFEQARTPYVFVLDADNSLYPRCLERHLAVLSECDASFSYSYLEVFGAVRGLQNTTLWDKALLQFGNMVDAMVMMRKNAWEQAGGYSIMEVMGYEDYDLWFKIANHEGWGVLIPEILARYRVHTKSMLRTITNPKSDRLREILLESYPQYFTDPYVRLEILTKAKRYEDAILECLEILKEKPDDSNIWKHLLWLYLQTNRFAEYQDAAVAMLSYCPELTGDLIDNPQLSTSMLKEVLTQAIYKNPNKFIFYQGMAKLSLLEGNLQSCIENAKIARQHYSKHKEALDKLIHENDIQEAQKLIDQWLKEEPQSPEALFYQAVCEVKQQKYFSALHIFDQLIKRGYQNHSVLADYIDTALRARKKGLALKLLEEFILLEPSPEWQEALHRLALDWPEIRIFVTLDNYFGANSRAKNNSEITLQYLLGADDLVEAFQTYSDRFDQDLIDYIHEKAEGAKKQNDQDFATLLSELAKAIEQWVEQNDVSIANSH